MNQKNLIGIAITIFISGCSLTTTGQVPTPGAPYSAEDIKQNLIMRGGLPTDIFNEALEKIAVKIKTFNGEEYVKSEKALKVLESRKDRYHVRFAIIGFVDEKNFDQYVIDLIYQNGTWATDQIIMSLWGIPTEWKKKAIDIAVKDANVKKNELDFIRWNPEKMGLIEMRFGIELISVDLITEKVVLIERVG